MRKFLDVVILVLIFAAISYIIIQKDTITSLVSDYFTGGNKEIVINKNEYYRDYDFTFVQNTNDFRPKNKQDLLNVYYTIINSGESSFTFYCTREYPDCISEVQSIANNQSILSDINNYVHPLNGFSNIETEYDSLGRVTVTIEKSYSKEEIDMINDKVDLLSETLIKDNDSIYNNILRVHDYIINNTIYDSDRSDYNIIKYKSDIAYGPLFEGYAICGGYTDLMELFLERMGIVSFKVSSDQHIWNAVYYNDNWLNLDLTWDDPVADDGKNYLEHNFFLISTTKLQSIEKTEHYFDFDVYKELKEA